MCSGESTLGFLLAWQVLYVQPSSSATQTAPGPQYISVRMKGIQGFSKKKEHGQDVVGSMTYTLRQVFNDCSEFVTQRAFQTGLEKLLTQVHLCGFFPPLKQRSTGPVGFVVCKFCTSQFDAVYLLCEPEGSLKSFIFSRLKIFH